MLEILYITAQLAIMFLRQLKSLWETVQVPKSNVYKAWHCSADSAECISAATAMLAVSPKLSSTPLWQWLQHVGDWFSIVTGRDTPLTCRSGKFCNSLSISPSALASLWQLQCNVSSIISCCIFLLTCLYTILCIFSFSIDDEYLYNCRWCSHFATPVKW